MIIKSLNYNNIIILSVIKTLCLQQHKKNIQSGVKTQKAGSRRRYSACTGTE